MLGHTDVLEHCVGLDGTSVGLPAGRAGYHAVVAVNVARSTRDPAQTPGMRVTAPLRREALRPGNPP